MSEKKQDLKYFKKRLNQLDTAYSKMKPLWLELARYFNPRMSKFLITDVNRKPKFSKDIVDSSTLVAVRNFSSGMMSGATNPAQKWFKLNIKNYKPISKPIQDWCAEVTDLLRRIFNDSNLYISLPKCFEIMGIFGIAVMAIEKDYETVIHTKVLPIGSFRIAKDYRGITDTLYRVYSETVANLVDRYGIENVSNRVKTLYENNNLEENIEIVHAVEPNFDYDKNSVFADKKRFISVYYEKSQNEDKFLEKAGFDHFPYITFETTVNGEDVYPSDCPGITSLPDVKQLMEQIRDYAKAIKFLIAPQLKGPSEMTSKSVVNKPGNIIPIKSTGQEKLEPVYQVNPSVLNIKVSIDDLKKIIAQIWYNDLFVMLNQSDYTQPRTATELNYRKEEAMSQLGPLLQQVYTAASDILDVSIDICADTGILPIPPKEIQNEKIDIEFVSMLAQAQKAYTINSLERTMTFACNVSKATGSSLAIDKLNIGEIIDDYAEYSNVDPDNIIPTDEATAKEAEREQQIQQQQQLEALEKGSNALEKGSTAVKNLGGDSLSGDDLLERLGLKA